MKNTHNGSICFQSSDVLKKSSIDSVPFYEQQVDHHTVLLIAANSRSQSPKQDGDDITFLQKGYLVLMVLAGGAGVWSQLVSAKGWVFHWQSANTRPPPEPPRKSILRRVISGEAFSQEEETPNICIEQKMCLGMSDHLTDIVIDEMRKNGIRGNISIISIKSQNYLFGRQLNARDPYLTCIKQSNPSLSSLAQ